MNLIELQNKIHEQNKAMGWWDEPRPFSTFVCLFHSELSEAMEGGRKGLMDDHLPQYEMFWVELADFVIRCLDYAGSIAMSSEMFEYIMENMVLDDTLDRVELVAGLHSLVSEMYRIKAGTSSEDFIAGVSACIALPIIYAKVFDVDLEKIILEKVEYNKHRADHKRENRAKEGGKKY